jgi:hypothetical protein
MFDAKERSHRALFFTAMNLYQNLNFSDTPVYDLISLLQIMREGRFKFIDLCSPHSSLTKELANELRIYIKNKIRFAFEYAVTSRVGSFDVEACREIEAKALEAKSNMLRGYALRRLVRNPAPAQ